jgi:hypothetical protein
MAYYTIPGNKLSKIVYCMINNPDLGYGCSLLICTRCGEIYFYEDMAALYRNPLEKQLQTTLCAQCASTLIETAKPYPEFYVDENMKINNSNKIFCYIDDINQDAVIEKEFWDLYS